MIAATMTLHSFDQAGQQAAPVLPRSRRSAPAAGQITGEAPGPSALTAREIEVLRHLPLGRSNRDIAALLTISTETVKAHVQHLLQKLGVANRTQAAVWAVRQKLI